MTNQPEVLVPAGTPEKLHVAIDYGADAVYIGGERLGLRSRASNFSIEDMREGAEYAHAKSAKVYLAANIVCHENELTDMISYLTEVRDAGIDAIIVSDPAIISAVLTQVPGLPVHLSTQASAVNYEAVNFWAKHGLERVVLGRETTYEEIKEIKEHTDVEIEAFIQGAMCISYSGRCVMSNYMNRRDANRGGCAQNCRFLYNLTDETGRSLTGDEQFTMSAVDMSLIPEIGRMLSTGVDSLKIEGRMKTIHYVSTVANVYRTAVDAYLADPDNFTVDPAWIEELSKISQRRMSFGFFNGAPSKDDELFAHVKPDLGYEFIGEVQGFQNGRVIIQERNNFSEGDELEFYGPNFYHYLAKAQDLRDEDNLKIERASHAMMICSINLDVKMPAGTMIRKKKTAKVTV
ncbi:peptidase U32 family protein [Xylocopilactobacillus apicola]|uniref:Protease n=1 Tax=Xylocopilactobacillus apicola TaxID=2932184 RepID=A0AAU9D672_9LACO|nr:U32 family peptidase [Xylocopilactobacillus apicola]BDR59038.1 protease [Xylocopilactobacillus apicola]